MTVIVSLILVKTSFYLKNLRSLKHAFRRVAIGNKRFVAGRQSDTKETSSATTSALQGNLQSHRSGDTIDYLDGQNHDVMKELQGSMLVIRDFLNENEEHSLMVELQPYMKRLRYEFDHWDNAIHGYRETEKLNWNKANTKIIQKVREIAFPPGVNQLQYVHVLDLAENGVIKPHVDSIRFCGDTIAGLNLLSDAVMRLAREKDSSAFADVLLPRRSLYIMKGTARYNYTHAVLANEDSFFKGKPVVKTRRVSVICRNEPTHENTTL